MQGRRFGVGGRGGGRGRGDTWNSSRSPVHSKIKDNRSGYRKNPILPNHLPRRRLSPLANRRDPHQSLSPLSNRPFRSPIHRRSPSIEQRGGSMSFDDEGFEFRHRYMVPGHPNELGDVTALLKPTRTMKDKDLAGPCSLIQESLFLDDGSKRTFYTLPRESRHLYDPAAFGSGSNLNIVMPQYDQPLGNPYEDKGGEKLYPKDVSFSVMPPAVQARSIVSASPRFSNDTDLLRMYGDRDGVGKFSDDRLEYNGYNEAHLSDQLRRGPLSSPVREEPLDYRHDELARRERDDYVRHNKSVYDPWGEHRDAENPSFFDLAGGRRVDEGNAYHKKLGEGSSWDKHQHSVQRDAAMDFRGPKGIQEDYVGGSGSGYTGFGVKASRDHELPSFEERYHLGGDVSPLTYRARRNSPLLVDRPLDMFRHGVSPSRQKLRLDDDFPTLDTSPERLLRRNYVTTDDLKRRNLHRRLQSPICVDEMWSHEEQRPIERRRFLSPKRPAIGHSQKNRLHSRRLPRNDGWGMSSDSSAHVEGGCGISLKKRLRPGPSDDSHGSLSLERGKELFRPNKVWRRVQEDRNNGLNATDDDILVDSARRVKNESPEDSEEFKKQVHKAFLQYSKLLNESLYQQKRYRDDQGKSSKLLCCVCGRLSKEFVDVHSLLAHSYHSRKVGLRTEHLGFHKALCLLNGWNWLVVPDTSNAYRQRPPDEIKTLKEDLILWPPVVIIRNSSIGNKSCKEPKIVSLGRMEEILKGVSEKGFGVGKTKVSRGKPANQSVLLAKFQPTLSGLQEAERLHKYFADNNRGRPGFKQITSNNGEAQRVEKDGEFLYGYMAVAEDLDKLDPETKRRSLVKSKKDIKAIADAPLKID